MHRTVKVLILCFVLISGLTSCGKNLGSVTSGQESYTDKGSQNKDGEGTKNGTSAENSIGFTGCEMTLDTLLKDLNEKRKAAADAPLAHEITDYGIVAKDDAAEFSEEEFANLTKSHSYRSEINLQQALEDLDTLMRILKTSYAGYQYFGGDEAFGKAKERIEKRLNETYGNSDSMTGYFNTIVLEELSFVEDSHLMLSGQGIPFQEKYIFYELNQYNFHQDSQGYYLTDETGKWYLSKDDEQYLHLTVDENGALVYGLFLLADETTQFPELVTVKAENGIRKELILSWTVADAGEREHNGVLFNYEEKDGIPVLELGGMSLNAKDMSMTNAFLKEAQNLRDQEVFILDLRGNQGGIADLTDFFICNLTGTMGSFKAQMVKRYSLLNLYHEEAVRRNMGIINGHIAYRGLDFYNQNKDLVDAAYEKKYDWHIVETGETFRPNEVLDAMEAQGAGKSGGNIMIPDEVGITAEMRMETPWKPYSNKIIVLIDKDTVSAGEYFLYELSSVENVVVMGENTNGCMITGDVNALSKITLPNSGISVMYGQTLALADHTDGFDSTGWMPDIITRDNALDAAIAILRYQTENSTLP